MAVAQLDVSNQIVAFKRKMAARREALTRAYGEVRDHVRRAVDKITADVAGGRGVVPELEYRDVQGNKVLESTRARIRSCGCAVVRGVIPRDVASEWFGQVSEYLETNHYEQREVEKRSMDKYFSGLKAGQPQVFN